MAAETPGNPEEAENELGDILNGVVDKARRKLFALLGPIEESGITKEQQNKLYQELKRIDDPGKRAKRVHEFYKENALNIDLPDEFADFMKDK